MIGKDNETIIEGLVSSLQKQELANKVQGYSDYVENDLQGKSFDSYCNEDPNLEEKKSDLKEAIFESVHSSIIDRDVDLMDMECIDESLDPENLTETRLECVTGMVDELMDIINGTEDED